MDNSNIGQIVRFLDDFVDSFDFLRPGTETILGEDIADRIVEGINERGMDEQRSTG